MARSATPLPFLETAHGRIVCGDSRAVLPAVAGDSVDLVVTSPPFALLREKGYGNEPADGYVDWFRPFAAELHRILRPSGSLVIDIGGAWRRGTPTRSLYHFKLLVMLVEEAGFHLAQELYWYNPAKLPTPAEWVTVRRIRLKDAVSPLWWLSKTPWPKASNERVLTPYSDRMRALIETGYAPERRPSGHALSAALAADNGAAIAPNLIALANTESSSGYLRRCRERGDRAPPPRASPAALPEHFVRMLTDPGGHRARPVRGELRDRGGVRAPAPALDLRRAACRLLRRRRRPLRGRGAHAAPRALGRATASHAPDLLWTDAPEPPLDEDGGRERRARPRTPT